MKKQLIASLIFLTITSLGYSQTTEVVLSDQTIAIFMKLVPQMDNEIAGATDVIGDDKSILEMRESFTTYKPLVDKIASLEQANTRLDEFFLILLSYPVLVFYNTLSNLTKLYPHLSLSDDPQKLLDALLKEDNELTKSMNKSQKEAMVATIKLMQEIKAYAGDKNLQVLTKHQDQLSEFFTQNM